MAERQEPDLYFQLRRLVVESGDTSGIARVLEVFLAWHRPHHVGSLSRTEWNCVECTGEYIIAWPCSYILMMQEHLRGGGQ